MITDRDLLIQVIQAQDDAARAGRDDDYTASVIDVGILSDFSWDNAGICVREIIGAFGTRLDERALQAAIAAAFDDGFVAGAKYQGAKDDQRT